MNPFDPNGPLTIRANYMEGTPDWFRLLTPVQQAETLCTACHNSYRQHSGIHCPPSFGHPHFQPIPPVGMIVPPLTMEATMLIASMPEPERVSTEVEQAKTINRITVRITKGARSILIKLSDGATMPSLDEIAAQLPRKHMQDVSNTWGTGWERAGYSLTEIMKSRVQVPLQVWSDAIASAIISTATDADPDEAETHIDKALASGGYFAIGGVCYKMTPTSLARPNALSIVRRNILERAKADATLIRDGANRSASEIMQKAIAARASADAVVAQAKRILPEWLLTCGYPVRIRGVSPNRVTEVGLLCEFAPTTWEWKYAHVTNAGTGAVETRIRRWPTVNAAAIPPVPTMLWVPFNHDSGTFAYTSIHVGDTDKLPHVASDRTCLGFGSALPKLITSAAEIRAMHTALMRALQVVNMASLLVGVRHWSASVQRWCPPAILNIISTDDFSPLQTLDLTKTGGTEETFNATEDARATFSI